jgi:hypothetical protein
VLSSPHH